MRVAVIGAGWAGLTAATGLLRRGADVHVFEAAQAPGGRARPLTLRTLNAPIDNGQHILLGAYRETFALMRSFGVEPRKACDVRPLALAYADGRLHLSLWPLPAPLHWLGAALAGRGLGGLAGRLHLWRVLRALATPHDEPRQTATQWLQTLGCPPTLMHDLWEPLCLAVANTAAGRMQATLFIRVLRDSLGAGRHASDVYIPRTTLHALWPQQACQLLGGRLQRRYVRALRPRPQGGWLVDDDPFDRVVLAAPIRTARTLLSALPRGGEFLAKWPQPGQSAIGTLTLSLARPWRSGCTMRLLHDDPAQDAWGQWLFDHSAIAQTPDAQCRVHVVIGAADRYAGLDSDRISDGILRQLRHQVPRALPEVRGQWLITERRATFDATVDLHRPATATPWPGLYLAGDWTDTGYPAVLEGAVRSGRRAAQAALCDLQIV